MQQTPDTDENFITIPAPSQVAAVPDAAPNAVSPVLELSALLSRAGTLAVSMGVDLDAWMKHAWSAFVDAQPGLREHLEEMQLMAQLTRLRQSGQIGQA